MLARSSVPPDIQKLWCLAYFMFYHAGVASRIAEAGPTGFFEQCVEAFTQKWPRGAERRHFRTQRAYNAVMWLQERHKGNPAGIIDQWLSGGMTFKAVTTQVKKTPEFGPWIAFKVADMLERVLRIPVDFVGCDLAFYKEPAIGLSMIHGDGEVMPSRIVVQETLAMMQSTYFETKASPWRDRFVGVQEFETIACKYKSHVHGHYPMGKDSHEVLEALHGWGPLAESLKNTVPRTVAADE